jgi:hypothetical protein
LDHKLFEELQRNWTVSKGIVVPRPGSKQKTVSIATKLLNEIDEKRKSLQQEREARMRGDPKAIDEFGDKLNSPGKFIGYLFEEFLNSQNLNIVLKRLDIEGFTLDIKWPSKALDKLCEQMDWYRSTEWIRTKNHAETIGLYQQPPALINRIRTCGQFKFEKMLIIPKEMWGLVETGCWVEKVWRIRSDNPGKDITVKVVREEKATDAQIDSEHFDMGIYQIGSSKPFIGYLDRKYSPPKYKWRLEAKYCRAAENAFSRIKDVAEPAESLGKMVSNYIKSLE